MTNYSIKLIDIVRITSPIKTDFVEGKDDNVILPAGTEGTVVEMVTGSDGKLYYIIEAYLEESEAFAVAGAPAEFLELVQSWPPNDV